MKYETVADIMKERDELRQQLTMADEESNMLAEAIAHAKWCNEQLAAAQAREARKNYALRQISLRPWHSQVGAIAEDALNLPSEDAALREMIAEAVAQEREACAETATDVAPGRDADAIADAIRARSQQ